MGGAFDGKLNGQIQKFTIQEDAIMDGQGNVVPDPGQIMYPKYDRYLGLTAAKVVLPPGQAHRLAEVTRDEFGDIAPTPALPFTTGDEPDESDPDGEMAGLFDSTAHRRQAAVRNALKSFSGAEKDALINEGSGGARNVDRLLLEGTHYELMPEGDAEDDNLWGW